MAAKLLHYFLWTLAFGFMGIIAIFMLDCFSRLALNHGVLP